MTPDTVRLCSEAQMTNSRRLSSLDAVFSLDARDYGGRCNGSHLPVMMAAVVITMAVMLRRQNR